MRRTGLTADVQHLFAPYLPIPAPRLAAVTIARNHAPPAAPLSAHPAPLRLPGPLLFAELCLLAAMAGILAWRHPGPGLLLFALIVCLYKPPARLPTRFFCLAAAFAAACCYTSLREPTQPPVPPWLERAAFGGNATLSGSLKPPAPFAVRADVAGQTPLPGNRTRLILNNLRPAEDPEGSCEPYSGQVVCTWYHPDLPLTPGESITARLRLTPRHGLANPGAMDTDSYWRDRNIWFRAYAGNKAGLRPIEPPPEEVRGLWQEFNALRQWLEQRFQANLSGATNGAPAPGSAAALLPALIFGDRSLLTPLLTDRFARATLAHSLALSGMHLGFAVLAGSSLAWLLGRILPGLWLRVTRPAAALLLALPFTFLYLWLGNAPISLVRAACMLCCWVILVLLKRPRVLLDGLFAALAFLLLVNPLSLFDLGLQLSALSIAAIALALPTVSTFAARLCPPGKGQNRSRARRVIRSGLVLVGLSFVIQIALLPLVVRSFGSSGLLFPLNLIWLPVLGTFVLPLAFAGLGLTALGLNSAAAFLLHAASLPCEGLLALLALLDNIGWLPSPLLPRPHWLSMAGYWLLCLALPGFVSNRVIGLTRHQATPGPTVKGGPSGKKRGPSALPVVLALLMLLAPPLAGRYLAGREQVRLTLLDVGQGQAVLVEWGGKKPGRLLLDGGGSASSFFDPGKSVVAPVLTDNALPRLDVVVASHPDTDHLGGLLFILEHFKVGRYFDNGVKSAPALAGREQRALEQSGLSRESLRAGDVLELTPDLLLETLWPTAEILAGPNRESGQENNNTSLVQRLLWKGRPLALFCGDVEQTAMKALLEQGADLSAPLLLLPHHGSTNSLSPDFYDAVAPDLALVSSGFGNQWGFPTIEVRKALAVRGINLINTAFAGQIRVTWDTPATYDLFTARQGQEGRHSPARPYPWPAHPEKAPVAHR